MKVKQMWKFGGKKKKTFTRPEQKSRQEDVE